MKGDSSASGGLCKLLHVESLAEATFRVWTVQAASRLGLICGPPPQICSPRHRIRPCAGATAAVHLHAQSQSCDFGHEDGRHPVSTPRVSSPRSVQDAPKLQRMDWWYWMGLTALCCQIKVTVLYPHPSRLALGPGTPRMRCLILSHSKPETPAFTLVSIHHPPLPDTTRANKHSPPQVSPTRLLSARKL